MGNYYSDYNGTASNGTGIGSTPSAYGDKYPLIQPVASYGFSAGATSAGPASSQTATTTVGQNSTGTGVPGFEGTYTVAGLAIVALALLGNRHRAK